MNLPPSRLMKRVAGSDDPDSYTDVGRRAAGAMMSAAARHSESITDVLDWGCGPGRVAVHLLSQSALRLRGCDIDREAIDWCNQNLAPGQFDLSPLYPPLPYADDSFDAVLGLSVMTHLHRRLQRRWLRELARVLRPGGVLVATVHGASAAAGFGVAGIRGGIEDHYTNVDLAGIAPDGYYRDVIQTEEYTRSAWASPWFEIAEYSEAAIDLHDLVVCISQRV